jgi:hypothetical protein
MSVCLRSHAEPSASGTTLASVTLIRRSRLSCLHRQARCGLHERPAKQHTHPRARLTTRRGEIHAPPLSSLCAAPTRSLSTRVLAAACLSARALRIITTFRMPPGLQTRRDGADASHGADVARVSANPSLTHTFSLWVWRSHSQPLNVS